LSSAGSKPSARASSVKPGGNGPSSPSPAAAGGPSRGPPGSGWHPRPKARARARRRLGEAVQSNRVLPGPKEALSVRFHEIRLELFRNIPEQDIEPGLLPVRGRTVAESRIAAGVAVVDPEEIRSVVVEPECRVRTRPAQIRTAVRLQKVNSPEIVTAVPDFVIAVTPGGSGEASSIVAAR
jgi:hypothetical protein